MYWFQAYSLESNQYYLKLALFLSVSPLLYRKDIYCVMDISYMPYMQTLSDYGGYSVYIVVAAVFLIYHLYTS